MAGEAATDVTPGEGVAKHEPAGEAVPQYDPKNLPPEALAAVNARLQSEKANIVAAERKRWEAEQEEATKQAEMTELEKERAARKALEEKATWAEEALGYERRRLALRDAASAKGLRSTVYVEHVLAELDDDAEFDADALAQKALDLYNADHGTSQTSRPKVAPVSSGGTPPRNTGEMDLSRMTSEEIAEYAKSLGPTKGLEFLNVEVRRFKSRGGRFANQQ